MKTAILKAVGLAVVPVAVLGTGVAVTTTVLDPGPRVDTPDVIPRLDSEAPSPTLDPDRPLGLRPVLTEVGHTTPTPPDTRQDGADAAPHSGGSGSTPLFPVALLPSDSPLRLVLPVPGPVQPVVSDPGVRSAPAPRPPEDDRADSADGSPENTTAVSTGAASAAEPSDGDANAPAVRGDDDPGRRVLVDSESDSDSDSERSTETVQGPPGFDHDGGFGPSSDTVPTVLLTADDRVIVRDTSRVPPGDPAPRAALSGGHGRIEG